MIRPSDFEELMAPAQKKWIVCEESGRWAAALRLAFEVLPRVYPAPRLYEVRMLGELSTHWDEHGYDLALIEVEQTNLTDVLQVLNRRGPDAQFVALLDDDVPHRLPVADLLWEIGAVEVLESPRQVHRLLALYDRLTAAQGPVTGGLADGQSFADWAWSTLPWQER